MQTRLGDDEITRFPPVPILPIWVSVARVRTSPEATRSPGATCLSAPRRQIRPPPPESVVAQGTLTDGIGTDCGAQIGG